MIRHANRVLIALIAATLIATPSAAGAPDFRAMEAKWNEAHIQGDMEALDQLWSDNMIVIVPGMSPMTKKELLAMWRDMPVLITRYMSSDISVTRIGKSAAVVSGQISRSRDFGGRLADEEWRFSKVYQKSKGEWRVVHFHASEVE